MKLTRHLVFIDSSHLILNGNVPGITRQNHTSNILTLGISNHNEEDINTAFFQQRTVNKVTCAIIGGRGGLDRINFQILGWE